MTLRYSSCVLFVKDLQISRHFYETLLEQKMTTDYGLNIGFEGGLSLWQNDSALQHIFAAAPQEGEAALGRKNLEVYFESDELEAVSQRLSAAGARILRPITAHPWGQLALYVYDPDGHIVEIGEPLPIAVRRLLDEGLTVPEIAQRMYMPVEAIQAMIPTN